MDVFSMLPEGTRCEVIDNALYMLPIPTTQHQLLLGELLCKINLFSNEHDLGTILAGPCDVYLDDIENVAIPDLIFIKKERQYIIEKKALLVPLI